jgi:hypothetical protein
LVQLRHRIIAPWVERLTAANPLYGQPPSSQ